MKTVFEMPIQIYIEDTDCGGIVYYANYLKFLERARSQWLCSLGFSKSSFMNLGFCMVVFNVQMQFKDSATLDDTLLVKLQIKRVTKARIVFWQTVECDDKMLVEAEVTVAYINLSTKKPCALPQAIYQATYQILA